MSSAVPFVAVMLAALVAGAVPRARVHGRFAVVFRTQTVVLVLPLGVLGGWAFEPRPDAVLAMLLVLVGELLAMTTGAWLNRGSREARFIAAGSQLNASFWSVPVATALFGPQAAVIPIVFETLLSPVRTNVAIWMLRSSAPVPPARRTALVDYSRGLAVAVGFALQVVVGAPGEFADVAISVLGLLVAAAGFGLLGLAMPRSISQRAWLAAARVLPLRFLPSAAVLAVAAAVGLAVPAGAWVLALAPCWFAYLSWARLYGHSSEHAAAVVLLSLPVAAALVPVVYLIGS